MWLGGEGGSGRGDGGSSGRAKGGTRQREQKNDGPCLKLRHTRCTVFKSHMAKAALPHWCSVASRQFYLHAGACEALARSRQHILIEHSRADAAGGGQRGRGRQDGRQLEGRQPARRVGTVWSCRAANGGLGGGGDGGGGEGAGEAGGGEGIMGGHDCKTIDSVMH